MESLKVRQSDGESVICKGNDPCQTVFCNALSWSGVLAMVLPCTYEGGLSLSRLPGRCVRDNNCQAQHQ